MIGAKMELADLTASGRQDEETSVKAVLKACVTFAKPLHPALESNTTLTLPNLGLCHSSLRHDRLRCAMKLLLFDQLDAVEYTK